MLVAAGVLHLLAIPIALFVLKMLLESVEHLSLSLEDVFWTVASAGGLGLLLAGIGGQVILGGVALAGAANLFRGNTNAAVPMIVAGVVGLVFSLLVFGGIIGMIGGILSIAGGMFAKPKRASIAPPYEYGSPLHVPPPPTAPPRPGP